MYICGTFFKDRIAVWMMSQHLECHGNGERGCIVSCENEQNNVIHNLRLADVTTNKCCNELALFALENFDPGKLTGVANTPSSTLSNVSSNPGFTLIPSKHSRTMVRFNCPAYSRHENLQACRAEACGYNRTKTTVRFPLFFHDRI